MFPSLRIMLNASNKFQENWISSCKVIERAAVEVQTTKVRMEFGNLNCVGNVPRR